MTAHQVDAFAYAWPFIVIAAASSAIQWRFSARGPRRALSAMHGVVFIGAFLFGVALAPFQDASVHLFLPFMGLVGAGFVACLANPFLATSRLSIALATSAASLGAGLYLTVFGAIAIQSTWF